MQEPKKVCIVLYCCGGALGRRAPGVGEVWERVLAKFREQPALARDDCNPYRHAARSPACTACCSSRYARVGDPAACWVNAVWLAGKCPTARRGRGKETSQSHSAARKRTAETRPASKRTPVSMFSAQCNTDRHWSLCWLPRCGLVCATLVDFCSCCVVLPCVLLCRPALMVCVATEATMAKMFLCVRAGRRSWVRQPTSTPAAAL